MAQQRSPLDYPKISDGYLGPQPKFDVYGLTALTHPEAVIELDSNRVQIEIGYNQPTRFTNKLLLCGSQGKELPESVMIGCGDDKLSYLLVLPQIGYYKFQLYALPSTEAGPKMIGVYNYLIHCSQMTEEFLPFPKQYPGWKNGCYMWEPLGLAKNTQSAAVPFKVFIPKAVQVMLKVGEDWTPLQQTSPDTWMETVDFSKGYPKGTKAQLNVKYGGHNFNTLLEYTL